MPLRFSGRLALCLLTAIGLVASSACRSEPEPEPLTKASSRSNPLKKGTESEEPKDEIPAVELPTVMAKHFEGLGFMEQYEYSKAVAAFREVHQRAPGWIPGSVNLAIALLNDTGVKEEQAKKSGGEPTLSNFDEALKLLSSILDRDPNNPFAHFCRGIILEQNGNLVEAHRHFKRVTEIDPQDSNAWYWLGSTVTDRDDPNRPAGPAQAKEQLSIFERAISLNPYLTPAIYKLAFAYRMAGQPEKQKELLGLWNRINPDRLQPVPGPGDSAEKKYGEMGRYATVIDPFARKESSQGEAAIPPSFGMAQPLLVKLPEGDRWIKPSDFTGPNVVLSRIRDRFGAGVAAFDVNNDGKLDLYLASAVFGPSGIRDVLLVNRGDGRFEDASAEFGMPKNRSSVGVAAGDFDADRCIDLFLTGVGSNRLLRNRDGKHFEDISSSLKSVGSPTLSLTARWVDLDQDGDLDLYVVNYCDASHAEKAFVKGVRPPGTTNTAYRNDGKPEPISSSPEPGWAPLAVAWSNVKSKGGLSIALTPWPSAGALTGDNSAHSGIAILDVDNDRDLDLISVSDGSPPQVILNDRLGQFHIGVAGGFPASIEASGVLVTDFDGDGRSDLVAPCASGPVLSWRNVTEKTRTGETKLGFEAWPNNAVRWRSSQAIDLDLDGRFDLLGTPASSGNSTDLHPPSWARSDGKRFEMKSLALGTENPTCDVVSACDLVGDTLPDLIVVRPGEVPLLAVNKGNGQNWLALQLGGHWRVKPELMRTNSHAIGTRVVLEGAGLHVSYEHTTQDAGLGQSITPIILGLGQKEKTDLVHLRWPDGVMQCELNIAANQQLAVGENNRKTGSCPVLFTWNGQRFVCIGDFLGGGGLGYLVAPGVYSQPDRDEAVAIAGDQLSPVGGVFRLSISEPMDEIAYIDHVRLEVIDRPPGVMANPDERFAPEGKRPTGELVAWKTQIEPVRSEDLKGRDLTETLRLWDRRTADHFRKRSGWTGYTEEHGIILDFGDRLSRYSSSAQLVLCLAGWVEYPYSQTNYAAATAGVSLNPPGIERLRSDGSWEVIEAHAGYPAGMPRLTTIELTGKLTGPNCVLRIKTNMECYYDQAFIAVRDTEAERSLRVSTLQVARAVLGYRGYTREVSPDGRQPLLYDYDYVDPAPLARFSGKLTRYGEVANLLQGDDDLLCLIGPGDEACIEFDAKGLPPLPNGWSRSYVLRSFGYCKDADPFTAASDTVGPLPWRRMPEFPFHADVKRSRNAAFDMYLRQYQTRKAGEGD